MPVRWGHLTDDQLMVAARVLVKAGLGGTGR